MLTTSVVGDKCTHDAVIMTGSATRQVNGQAVARLGDLVNCPQHGINKIVAIQGGMPLTDGLLTAHETATSECGAEILMSVFQGVAGGGAASVGEAVAIETEDMTPAEKRTYLATTYGGGSTAIADSIARASGDGTAVDPGGAPVTAPAVASVNLGCDGITDASPDTTKISSLFTVANFSSAAGLPHAIPPVTAKGLSRATVICNLKHLASNSIDKAFAYIQAQGYSAHIGSGFRNETNGSDHNIGSAADLWIYKGGERVSRATLKAIALGLIQTAQIPFTQMLLEFTASSSGWIHIANRRTGGNSALHVGYTLTGGKPYGTGLPNL